ncbi:hypothetical protein Pmani_017179 [Petrolisthes manimaculis]|uniref:Uncharacterized protein n=1 Tax=Petrolisthes manimaculis TaxID=1843537 RepID=A0AAE1PNX4_9EUCA|nr:hypothetical protein Pmani_017179 [Petrolisthes manimaculis]
MDGVSGRARGRENWKGERGNRAGWLEKGLDEEKAKWDERDREEREKEEMMMMMVMTMVVVVVEEDHCHQLSSLLPFPSLSYLRREISVYISTLTP